MRKRSAFSLAMCLTLGAYGQTAVPDVASKTITAPVLVEMKSGEIAYGLSASDFSIRDNGIEQRVELGSETSPKRFSLVLVIQTGHNAASQLVKIIRLDTLLDGVRTGPTDQAAIIAFDRRPELIQEFTSDRGAISNSLASIAAGNSGSALFDAMHMALELARKAPVGNRNIIVLISGEQDHGSNASDSSSLIRDVAASDVSVYGVSFRDGRKELFGKLRSLNPLAITANAMERNSSEALAQLTGGEFCRFDSERSFEDRITEISDHINNRYNLVFRPSGHEPGFHSLQIEVRRSKMDVLSARSGYWVADSSAPAEGGVRQ